MTQFVHLRGNARGSLAWVTVYDGFECASSIEPICRPTGGTEAYTRASGFGRSVNFGSNRRYRPPAHTDVAALVRAAEDASGGTAADVTLRPAVDDDGCEHLREQLEPVAPDPSPESLPQQQQ